jgi:hypothetical protein
MGDDLLRQAIAAMSPERQEAIRQRSLELLRTWGTVELTEATPDRVPAQISHEAGNASLANGHTIDEPEQTPAPQAGDNEALAALARAVQEAIAARLLMEATPGAPHHGARVAGSSPLG